MKPEETYWRGKAITTLTRDGLIEAVMYLMEAAVKRQQTTEKLSALKMLREVE